MNFKGLLWEIGEEGEIGKERERGKNLQYIDHLHLKYKVKQSIDLREQMRPLDHFHLQKKNPECKYWIQQQQ